METRKDMAVRVWTKAVNNVNTVIADALLGMNVTDQVGIDRVLLELDGTPTRVI